MLIKGPKNQSAEINLFAFEAIAPFTEIDAAFDWIETEFKIKCGEQQHHITDPSLTAADVKTIIEWFTDLAKSVPTAASLRFIEPNLSLYHVYNYDKQKLLKVCFDAELRPEWANADEEYAIHFLASSRQLLGYADALTRQLENLYTKAGVNKEEVNKYIETKVIDKHV